MNLTIPLRLPSVANARMHWAAKARLVKSQRNTVAWMLGNKPRPALPVVVTLTRIAPRPLDDDNAVSSMKAPRDEVASWLGVDDRDPRVTWAYAQRRGKVREHAVEIVIAGRVAA